MPPTRNQPNIQSQGWSKPTKIHGPQWNGFVMSDLRKDQSRRRQAKCTYCNKQFNQAKPTQLFSHIKDSCVAIPAEKKAEYIRDVLKDSSQKFSRELEETSDNNDGQMISDSVAPAGQSKSVENYFRAMSREKTCHLHELLTKALLSSNIPMTLLENPYFQEYQSELARSPYQLPRRVQVMEKILPMVHARHEAELFKNLKDQKQMTLSLDGWTDNSGNSIYALLALKGTKKKYFLDVLDLNSKRHTADNIFSAIKSSLKAKQLDFEQFGAIRIVNEEHPHILQVHCTLHVFNLIAKRLVNHPSMAEIVKANKTLVNYFSQAGFWRKHLATWQKENEIKHGLKTLCETWWYSMAKVCLGVQSHEIGFRKCLELLRDPLVDTPSMTKAVIEVIEDRDHFTGNQTLVCLLKPVVDAIGNLERAETTLADIWKELLDTYKNISEVDVYTRFEPFKVHCLDVIHAQTKVYHEEIYIVAFFLHPAYRRVAVSKKHSLPDIGQMILQLAKNWRFTKSEASLLKDSINCYYNAIYPFNLKNTDKPLEFWLAVPHTPDSEPMKKLAIGMLNIVPHAAGVEGLFSMMSAIKTKFRN
ncbi:hypothetical protein PTTG_00808 [Puccinia triticina 1-1 BBBD Race 1]|uniref:BED-type domain-containing protein n=1 Tax=Puccinia triticina (isolate 1-1 / race 1 (BBBD)) TaxID=630390 RepID=A0A180GVT1_PUCT1|nr:hypothetical protein PTTG_00808 [Puccinia triticina 1-1 BBBD Race 1]